MASIIPKIVIPILLVIHICVDARPDGRDTLNIRYRLVGANRYFGDQNIIRIKVPPFLSTEEVMEQVKLALQWPGDPPPKKVTKVYVFKEMEPDGEKSPNWATFVPGKGISWNLTNWKPTEFSLSEPTVREKLIYRALLDTVFSFDETETKKKIANDFGITRTKLDSIYFKVKYWNSQ